MGRRVKGEGSIYQRKDGYYVAKYNGACKYSKTSTQALDNLNELKARVGEAEKADAAEEKTISDAITEWLGYKSNSLKATSYDRLRMTVESHVIPSVGEMLCSDFSETVFTEKIMNPMKKKGLSFSSIKKSQDAMCAFSRWASSISRRYMPFDPMSSFERIRKAAVSTSAKESADGIRYFSFDERLRFTLACRATWSNGSKRFRHGEAFIFCMYTGLRIGELLALRCSDVNIEEGYVRVSANVSYVREVGGSSKRLVRNNYTKSDRPRVIPLSDTAIESAKRVMCGKDNNDASLFVQNANGDIVSPIAIIASMHSVLELAGIVLEKAHCTHVLRHTFASMCFAARIPVKTVSEMLGHSSVQITMDIYIHLIQENGVPLVPEIKAMV